MQKNKEGYSPRVTNIGPAPGREILLPSKWGGGWMCLRNEKT